MYLVPLKSAVTEALKNTFGPGYSNPDFANLHVSIEYPDQPQHYPGIWINYEDTGDIVRAGINQLETVTDFNGVHQVTRWRFTGSLSFTVAAFSSLERDRLYDEMVRIIAFANVDTPQVSTFRETIESNDFLGINVQYDVLSSSGDAATPGTPWGSQDETIYERTLSTDVIGEFVSDPTTNSLVILSAVQVQGYLDGTLTPNFPDGIQDPNGALWSPNAWDVI